MQQHRALPHGEGWFFNGQYFETKGACVAYMIEHVGLGWRTIATAFPNGTKGNCKSAYNHFRQKRARDVAKTNKPAWT